MILMVGSYIEEHEGRMAEYATCLERNLAHPCIDGIDLLVEDPVDAYSGALRAPERESLVRLSKILLHPKLRRIDHGRRLTYNTAFDHANRSHPGQIVMLANSDIHFDGTLKLMERVDFNACFVALTRNDINGDINSICFSQDVWAFKTPVPAMNADFHLGIPGCDNRIAYEITAKGYRIINPFHSVNAIHLHGSMIRHYIWPSKGMIPGPYFYPGPCVIPPNDPVRHPCCSSR